jgi:hypothetical protein
MKDFRVALSFAGEQRSLVSAVAERLAAAFGREQVFYDRYYEAELARPDLDIYLEEIYRNRSELVVVFIGADYNRKEWPGLEWRAVRDLIKSRASDQIMLIRVGDGDPVGLFGVDGWLDARGLTSDMVADQILDRCRSRVSSFPVVETEMKAASTEAQKRVLPASRPNLSACATLLKSNGVKEFRDLHYLFRLLMSITNGGAPATLWASITVEGELVRAVGRDLCAIWNHNLAPECRITTNETRRIRVADSRVDADLRFSWFVPFVQDGKLIQVHAKEASLPGCPHPKGNIQVSVAIFSDPPSIAPHIECGFTLVGCDQVTPTGVSFCSDGIPEGFESLEIPG